MAKTRIRFLAILGLGAITACSEPAAVELDWDNARLVTTEELELAYEENEVAAQQNFGDQPLYVRGQLDDILLTFDDEPMLNFKSEGLLPIQAVMPGEEADTAQLKKGQTVTLGCTDISEVLGSPMLGGCFVVEVE